MVVIALVASEDKLWRELARERERERVRTATTTKTTTTTTTKKGR